MKIAIVTGASSGMGKEFVKQIELLYKELDEIWIIARRKERLEELKSQMYTHIHTFDGDIKDEILFKQIKNRLENQNPDIRMLVNAAGFGKTGMVDSIEEEAQLDMIDVNCKGLTHMTTLCMPYMQKGSRIVNLASAAAFCPQPSFAVYAATKSYVLSFSRALGVELEDRGIIVTAVCPGPVKTEFFDVAGHAENSFKDAVMVEASQVVKQALVDTKQKKSVSIYGAPMKGAKIATKLLPHEVVLKAIKTMWN
ncbi:MAG: SDR family NAD(P)-dependent oxidoreductase [Lachnospiraceae bacterium]